MSRLSEFWKRLYANKTFYRVFWTTIQVGAGLAAAELSDNAEIGLAVVLLTTILTSIARERLSNA